MRIVGGEWRGRPIESPRGRDISRPTTDRVREAIASMLESALDGASRAPASSMPLPGPEPWGWNSSHAGRLM